MIDRLRVSWNRRLRDGDRARLFALVVGVIVGVAGALAILDDAGPPAKPSPPRDTRPAATPPMVGNAPRDDLSGDEPVLTAIAHSRRIARRFLAAYLPFSYGHGDARQLPTITPALRDVLIRERPRVPPAVRALTPEVTELTTVSASRERVKLVALVNDGQRLYTVPLEITSTPTEAWMVTDIWSF